MAKAAGITKTDLKAFLKIEENRKALNRIAGDFEKQAKQFKEDFTAHVEEFGGSARMVVVHGHRLTLHTENGTVNWKQEFEKLAGVEAAEKLIKQADKRVALKIESIDEPSA